MGRRATKAKPAADELPAWLRHFLMTGAEPAEGTAEAEAFFEARFLTDAVGEAWERHREALVAECVKARPGTRPWYWWVTIGTDDETLPKDGEPRVDYVRRLEAFDGESEAAELRRRGLLQPGEERRIPAEDFEPVPDEAA